MLLKIIICTDTSGKFFYFPNAHAFGHYYASKEQKLIAYLDPQWQKSEDTGEEIPNVARRQQPHRGSPRSPTHEEQYHKQHKQTIPEKEHETKI